MKKPRLPTEEEVALFQESIKGTDVKMQKKIAANATAKGVAPSSLTAGRDEEAVKSEPHAQDPLTLTRSHKGRRDAPAAPLSPLSRRELMKRAKPYGPVEATLDLHGLTQGEALPRVQQFLARAQQNGLRHVAIITGKGRGNEMGILRKMLPEWLNEPALRRMVAGFGHAAQEKGGSGVLHVLVKKP